MHESEQESNVHGPYAEKCMGHCDILCGSGEGVGRRWAAGGFGVVQAGPEIYFSE